jgi:hypothetical protein
MRDELFLCTRDIVLILPHMRESGQLFRIWHNQQPIQFQDFTSSHEKDLTRGSPSFKVVISPDGPGMGKESNMSTDGFNAVRDAVFEAIGEVVE